MSELCRICMFPKFDLINLVKDGTDTLERSGEKFEDCFGIKVKELPYCQRICKECDKHLIDFYYFKQQALRTHNYLIDKACDLQAKCVDIKEEIDINDLQIRDNTPDEFCNIEYLDEDAAHVAPLEFVKKESEDEIIAIKQEKDEIESTDDTPSEVLDSYEQIESLMYEDANESISEDRIESEGVADNTKDNEGEEDKKPKENTVDIPELNQRILGTPKGRKRSWKRLAREDSQDEYHPSKEKIKKSGKRKKKKKLSEDVNYRCEICKKPFATEDLFKAHLRVHNGLPRYSCELCDKTFKEKNKYEYHMKNHKGERNWKCSICNKGFLIEWDLELHMRTHTDYRPYICEICGKAFRVYCHLSEHRETHNETNVFECVVCKARLHTSKTLRGHMASAHKIGNLRHCKLCNQSFVRLNRWKLHMNKHHPTVAISDAKVTFVEKRYGEILSEN